MSRAKPRANRTRTCPDCGFTRTYLNATEGEADYALSKHSCDKKHRLDDRARRGQARRDAVDHTPKPCSHPKANHRHGEYATYMHDRCRCTNATSPTGKGCAEAKHDYEVNRVRQHAYGRWDHWVDGDKVRAHVARLRDAGMGTKRIGDLAGISHGAMSKLLYGRPLKGGGRGKPSAKVLRTTAEAILAVQPTLENLAAGQRFPVIGAARRLQALVALGYSQRSLAQRLGIMPANFTSLVHGTQPFVSVRTHRQVCDLYAELARRLPEPVTRSEKGAVTRAKKIAAKYGWVSPMAWDDIDDPNEKPHRVTQRGNHKGKDEVDEAVVERVLAGEVLRCTKAEKDEVVRRWRAEHRGSMKALLERMGWKDSRYGKDPGQAA